MYYFIAPTLLNQLNITKLVTITGNVTIIYPVILLRVSNRLQIITKSAKIYSHSGKTYSKIMVVPRYFPGKIYYSIPLYLLNR